MVGRTDGPGDGLENAMNGGFVAGTRRQIHRAKRVSNHLMNAFDDSVGLRILDRRRLWCDTAGFKEFEKLRSKLGSVVADNEFGTRTATEPLAIDDERDVFTSLGGAGSKFNPASSGIDHRNGLDMAIDAIGVGTRPGTKEVDLHGLPGAADDLRDWKMTVFDSVTFLLAADLTVLDEITDEGLHIADVEVLRESQVKAIGTRVIKDVVVPVEDRRKQRGR